MELIITNCQINSLLIEVDTLIKVKPISLIFVYLADTGIA